MDLKMACTSWIKDNDEKILKVLQEADRWLSVEELSEATGLPAAKVEHTLKLLKQQMDFFEGRKSFFEEE